MQSNLVCLFRVSLGKLRMFLMQELNEYKK